MLFTDIEGSSRMTNALGDAVYREEMRAPHCDRIRKAIAVHGGYEVKTIGDSFMVAFDTADQALACSVEIQQHLSEPAIERDGWVVRVRIGVHTAERELLPDASGDYSGADVNFAARVESLGEGEQILVSDSSHAAAGSRQRYAWRAWPQRRIKSFDQPETVWELCWDERERKEPGSRWHPDWYLGEPNRYIPRPDLEEHVFHCFAHIEPGAGAPRLVTLHGFGGMGKTRLAIACATRMAAMFPDGVFFVRLDDKDASLAAVLEAICTAIGLPADASLPDQVVAALRERNILVILDNYESVACEEVASFIGDLVLRTRYARLLVTGRAAVHLWSIEQLVSLEEGMSDSEGEALFIARAQLRRAAKWTPTPEELAQIRRVVALSERMPLAIELAAAWAGLRTIKEIADGIQRTPLQPPPPGMHGQDAARHQSQVRSIEWSLRLLDAPSRDAFIRLGVFADTWTAESAEAICAIRDAQGVLDCLHEAALIVRVEVGGESRYTMKRPARAYVAEKVGALRDARRLRKGFVAWFRRAVEENGDINDPVKRAALDTEWRNAVAAAEVAEALKDWGAVCAVSEHLASFLLMRGLWSEKEQLDRAALKAAVVSGDVYAQGRAHRRLGSAFLIRGRWAEAEEHLALSLDIERHLGDRAGESKTLHNLGVLYLWQGRHADAEARCGQCLTIRRECADRAGEAQTLNVLGAVFGAQKRLDEALATYLESLAICRDVGDRVGEGESLNNLGNVYLMQDRFAQAEECYQKSLQICREMDNRVGEGETCINLGGVYHRQGRHEDAQASYLRARELCKEFHNHVSEAKVLEDLAILRREAGDACGALAFATEALKVLEETEDEAARDKVRRLVADIDADRACDA